MAPPTPRKKATRPAKRRRAQITEPFYRRMIANPDARIPFLLT